LVNQNFQKERVKEVGCLQFANHNEFIGDCSLSKAPARCRRFLPKRKGPLILSQQSFFTPLQCVKRSTCNNSLIFPSRNGRHHGRPTNPKAKTNKRIIKAIFFIDFSSFKYLTPF
jgi:hypothetical protein